eukprot:4619123-Lingulodinium_polyedra.AAC.1
MPRRQLASGKRKRLLGNTRAALAAIAWQLAFTTQWLSQPVIREAGNVHAELSRTASDVLQAYNLKPYEKRPDV